MIIKNLFESAYYRRLIIAYIIDEQGPVSAVELVELLNWPKSTIKSNISGLQDMGICIEYKGSRKTGGYELSSWGPVKKSWIRQRYSEILESLDDFSIRN